MRSVLFRGFRSSKGGAALATILLCSLTVWASESPDSSSTDANTRAGEFSDQAAERTAEDASDLAEEELLVPDEYEEAMAQLIVNHPQQERGEMVYDPYLHLVARAKVLDMARRKYKSHVDPDGFGPNHVVRTLGYELPTVYSTSKNANNIESFVWMKRSITEDGDHGATGPSEVAAEFIKSWFNSPNHKKHLLGQGFNADQTRYGIGHAQADDRKRSGGRQNRRIYGVFITAPPSGTEPLPLTRDVVHDYLSRTPAEREKEARAQRSR